MTTTPEFTDAQILSKLDELAAAHPGRYDTGTNTPHKEAADVSYSYDDCIIGCLISDLIPELHTELLAYETRWSDSFQLANPVGTPAYGAQAERRRQLIADIEAHFTPEQFRALALTQTHQDGGSTWPAAVEIGTTELR